MSRQGVNIAFIGLNRRAQTACTEYLVRRLGFKRIDMDEPVTRFLRTAYNYHQRNKIDLKTVRAFYHEVHKLDADLLINHFRRRFEETEIDVVTPNVDYMNELLALREMGFTIVRVTSAESSRPRVADYVKGADDKTVALAMMYNRTFSADYSIHYTSKATRAGIIEPLLENLGYKI